MKATLAFKNIALKAIDTEEKDSPADPDDGGKTGNDTKEG